MDEEFGSGQARADFGSGDPRSAGASIPGTYDHHDRNPQEFTALFDTVQQPSQSLTTESCMLDAKEVYMLADVWNYARISGAGTHNDGTWLSYSSPVTIHNFD